MHRDIRTAIFSVRVPHSVGDALIEAQAKTGLKWRKIAQQAIIACANDPEFYAQLTASDTEKVV